MDSYEMQTDETKRLLDGLIDFVNRLPLGSKADRMRLLTKMVEEQFTTDPKEAAVCRAVQEEDEEKKEDTTEAEPDTSP
jgi:hypothetical protein